MRQLFVLVLLFLAVGCKDDTPEFDLPEKTQKGLNTLGFIVDGRNWINYGTRCTYAGCKENKVDATLTRYQTESGPIFELSISAGYTVAGKEIDQSFTIYCQNASRASTYNLDANANNKMIFVSDHYVASFKEFVNTKSADAILVITRLDTIKHIVAGEFYGTLSNPNNPTETIILQEGRFDSQLEYRKPN